MQQNTSRYKNHYYQKINKAYLLHVNAIWNPVIENTEGTKTFHFSRFLLNVCVQNTSLTVVIIFCLNQ